MSVLVLQDGEVRARRDGMALMAIQKGVPPSGEPRLEAFSSGSAWLFQALPSAGDVEFLPMSLTCRIISSARQSRKSREGVALITRPPACR